MILSPIRKVLSSIASHDVRALLMGGQACILYGGAEFSRDIDFAILASDENLLQLKACLDELEAEVIAVPPFTKEHLERGHAIHFRCRAPEAAGLRVDVMTKLRGVDDFEKLWSRRVSIRSDEGTEYNVMSLPDLVQAKKTQRDKDWPMIRRLLEANYFENRDQPDTAQVEFWFRELRTPELLIELATEHPDIANELSSIRPLLRFASINGEEELVDAIHAEEKAERSSDREYWLPLRAELERLRLERKKS